MKQYDILIVGAGHAGAQSAIALRQLNFAGTIAVVGDELDLPYERPPLSKEYLSGEKQFERILIRPAPFWSERRITFLLGQRVTEVNAAERLITTSDGTAIGYRDLIWATGGAPRRLDCQGANLPGVHAVRTRTDVDRIINDLPFVEQVVVVGGGYIGLEAAAVLSKLGKRVTILEAQDRVLARVAGEPLSRFYEDKHRANGVDVRLGVGVDGIEGQAGRVAGVRTSDGKLLPAQLVIVGIGIIPSVQPLIAAGAEGGNGVKVDQICRTTLSHIWAIGDCALHTSTFADGADIRLESIQNATDMATTVAKAMTGAAKPYCTIPWFWSNQYELKLQTIGLSMGYDKTVLRGNPKDEKFSVVYLREGRIIAIDCVNAVKDYVQGRALVIAGTKPCVSSLADTAVELKGMVPMDVA